MNACAKLFGVSGTDMGDSLFKLTSFNLNGIRSASSKGLEKWLDKTQPNCMCVQEIKAQASDLAGQFEVMAGLSGYFHCAEKKGYSGVGIYTRHIPSAVIAGFDAGEFDAEGRCLELRFDTAKRKLSLLSVYFPSGSSGPERQLAKYRFLDAIEPHLMALKRQRSLIVCGDLNIAHQEKDLKNWRSNQQSAGFLPEERAWMTQLTTSGGMVDVYRRLHPDTTDGCYTWWSNRGQAYANNVGWRLDYQLATPDMAASAKQVSIYKEEKFSDHAPITVTYDWTV